MENIFFDMPLKNDTEIYEQIIRARRNNIHDRQFVGL